MKLSHLGSYDNLSSLDVVLTSSQMEEVDSAFMMLLEVASWLHRWFVTAQLLVLENSSDLAKCHWLFVTFARTAMMISIALVLWVNAILERCY